MKMIVNRLHPERYIRIIKERISDLKSEQKSLLSEQKKVEAELKDVDYRLTQISDIIKIVEQSESTDQVSIPKILMIWLFLN